MLTWQEKKKIDPFKNDGFGYTEFTEAFSEENIELARHYIKEKLELGYNFDEIIKNIQNLSDSKFLLLYSFYDM